jgi:ferredoxin-NADP reductase
MAACSGARHRSRNASRQELYAGASQLDWTSARSHVDIRLTAADGYKAQRSYSIASPPEDKLPTDVKLSADGEASPYLLTSCVSAIAGCDPSPGIVWTSGSTGSLSLVAGGTGITPLMAMLRHRDRSSCRTPTVLIYSARSRSDIVYREELGGMARNDNNLRIIYALTREQAKEWAGHRGRVDRTLLAAHCFPPAQKPAICVCGPTAFVESVSGFLVELGYDPLSIKTERFGPSGG